MERDDLIGRMARGILAAEAQDRGVSAEWADLTQELERTLRNQARAALEAIREPTAGMLLAARDRIFDFDTERALIPPDPKADIEGSAEYIGRLAWLDMIDAALAENTAKPIDGPEG